MVFSQTELHSSVNCIGFCKMLPQAHGCNRMSSYMAKNPSGQPLLTPAWYICQHNHNGRGRWGNTGRRGLLISISIPSFCSSRPPDPPSSSSLEKIAFFCSATVSPDTETIRTVIRVASGSPCNGIHYLGNANREESGETESAYHYRCIVKWN